MVEQLAFWVQVVSPIVQVAITAALFWITFQYTRETRRQADSSAAAVVEMQRTRALQARAYVSVEVRPWNRNNIEFDLVIRNYGAAAARDVRVEFNENIFVGSAEENLKNRVSLKRIPFVAPHDKLVWYLGSRDVIMPSGTSFSNPTVWIGKAYFSDDVGTQEMDFKIDLADLDKWGDPHRLRRGTDQAPPLA